MRRYIAPRTPGAERYVAVCPRCWYDGVPGGRRVRKTAAKPVLKCRGCGDDVVVNYKYTREGQ